jgi:hypothetical protein
MLVAFLQSVFITGQRESEILLRYGHGILSEASSQLEMSIATLSFLNLRFSGFLMLYSV